MDAFGIRAILPRPKGQGLPRIQIKRIKLIIDMLARGEKFH